LGWWDIAGHGAGVPDRSELKKQTHFESWLVWG